MGKNALVIQVLEASAGCASDMTHALRSLGGGDMGAGIMAIWAAGKKSGLIQGAFLTTIVYSLVIEGVLLYRHLKSLLNESEHKTAETNLKLASVDYSKSM